MAKQPISLISGQDKFDWMTCNSLCLCMRAFELNVSFLIRKGRLGDNDICWLWKEKTSNQHILTRQGLCFLTVLCFDISTKLWTYKTVRKREHGQNLALGKQSGCCLCWLQPRSVQEGVAERRKVLTSSSMAGAASLQAPV